MRSRTGYWRGLRVFGAASMVAGMLAVGFSVGAQQATPEVTPEPVPGRDNSIQGNTFITETLPFDESFLEHLMLPEGFGINVFAQGLGNARIMATAADGTILLTRRMEGDVIALTDADNNGEADSAAINVGCVRFTAGTWDYRVGRTAAKTSRWFRP